MTDIVINLSVDRCKCQLNSVNFVDFFYNSIDFDLFEDFEGEFLGFLGVHISKDGNFKKCGKSSDLRRN